MHALGWEKVSFYALPHHSEVWNYWNQIFYGAKNFLLLANLLELILTPIHICIKSSHYAGSISVLRIFRISFGVQGGTRSALRMDRGNTYPDAPGRALAIQGTSLPPSQYH